ncbi:MAG: GTP-binding and nucleic acid-binding protein YchF, partial [uncultured Chloroflexia bacterium]
GLPHRLPARLHQGGDRLLRRPRRSRLHGGGQGGREGAHGGQGLRDGRRGCRR